MIILPGDPIFDYTLATAQPPGWADHSHDGEGVAMVVDHSTGIMRPANRKEMIAYVEGGEYDERLEAIGEGENADF